MRRLLISLNVTRPFSRNVTRKQHQKQQNKSNNHFSNTIKLPLEQEKKRWSDLDLFQSASLCKNLLARGKYEDLRGKKITGGEGKCWTRGPAEPVPLPARSDRAGLRAQSGDVNLRGISAQQPASGSAFRNPWWQGKESPSGKILPAALCHKQPRKHSQALDPSFRLMDAVISSWQL